MSNPGYPSLSRLVLPLVCATLAGCFQPITLPACEGPADCPGGYIGCDTGYCVRSSARCDAAAAVPGDGCCFVGDGERAGDLDCVGFAVTLEGSAFAGPTLDPTGSATYVATRAPAPTPEAGAWVWLTRVEHDGSVAWRVPVGPGGAAPLAAPVATVDGVWVAFEQGLRGFDAAGAERDVVADAPAPGHLAVDGAGRLAWWSAARSMLVVRGAAPGSLEHVVSLAAEGGGLAGPVFATGGGQVVMAAGSHLGRFAATDGAPAGEAALAEAVADLAVSAGRLYVLEGARQVRAYVLAAEALPEAWASPLELPADARGQVMIDEAGRLVVPAAGGRVLVVTDAGTSAHLREVTTGAVEAGSLVLLADDWLVLAAGDALAAGRLEVGGGQATWSPRWRQSLGNLIVGAPLADPEGHVLVLDGVGRLARLVSGASGPARAGWPTVAGATSLSGVEAGAVSNGTEEP